MRTKTFCFDLSECKSVD